jgi:hypothetical protein
MIFNLTTPPAIVILKACWLQTRSDDSSSAAAYAGAINARLCAKG